MPALIKALDDESAQVRLAAIIALGAIRHAAAVEPLALSLARVSRRQKSPQEGDHQVSPGAEYEALAAALGTLGGAAVPVLLRQLDSDDSETRRWIAHALGLARDPQAVGPLVKRLGDSRSDVRKAAALALGEIGDMNGFDPLIKALEHRDHETRRAAAIALGSFGSEQSVDSLCAILEDPNEPVQLAVVEALRKIGGLQAGAGLRAAIEGGRKNVRESAAAALRSLKFAPATAEERAAAAVLIGDFASASKEGEAALGALSRSLGSKDASRRRQGVESLAMLRSQQALEPLLRAMKDRDPTVQDAAAKALVGIGPAALQGLVGMLAHHDPVVQRLAARSLGEIADPQAATALADLIEQNCVISNEYPEVIDVVRAAVTALAAMLSRVSSSMPAADLRRIAGLPDAARQAGGGRVGEPVVECAAIRDLALQELNRRG
jgi:HEAT repeat protein